jgi:hypothetical protein
VRDWKACERRVAAILGGRRVPVSGRQRGYAPDIEHPSLAIEVKSRAAYPAWLEDAMRQAEASARYSDNPERIPVAVLHRGGERYADDLVVVRLSHFARNFTENREYTEAGEKGA